jgi:hypothetical protein
MLRSDQRAPWIRAISSAGERCLHTAEVTGSIPVSPTIGGPGFRGLQSFLGMGRAALGPRERWLPLASDGSGVAWMRPRVGEASDQGRLRELW